MKYLIHSIAALFLLVSCSIKTEKDHTPESIQTTNSEIHSYITNAIAIEQRKQELLSISDSSHNFLFSDDAELQAKDPHAYWLMNRMMQMNVSVQSADDCWAWMLAMNECVATYNHRLNREIGSINAAANAMYELIRIYTGGNQGQINSACSVISTIEYYKLIYAYYEYLGYYNISEQDDRLKTLCFYEFKEWYNINHAMNGILRYYTSADAHYSARSMDINETIKMWSNNRLAELKIEDEILQTYDGRPFKSEAQSVFIQKFDLLLNTSNWKADNNDLTDESTEESDESLHVLEMIYYYKAAIKNWREVREQICMMLPAEKQDSYQEIAKQIHTRLYNDLEDLNTKWY